jgi:hypothetical protein
MWVRTPRNRLDHQARSTHPSRDRPQGEINEADRRGYGLAIAGKCGAKAPLCQSNIVITILLLFL